MAPQFLPIFGYEGDFKQITYIGKLREKDEKCIGIESRSMRWEFRVLTARPQVLNFEYKVKILLQKIDKKNLAPPELHFYTLN